MGTQDLAPRMPLAVLFLLILYILPSLINNCLNLPLWNSGKVMEAEWRLFPIISAMRGAERLSALEPQRALHSINVTFGECWSVSVRVAFAVWCTFKLSLMHYFKAVVDGAVKEETFVYIIGSKTESFLRVSSSPWLIQVMKWANLSPEKALSWTKSGASVISKHCRCQDTCVSSGLYYTPVCVCKYFRCFLFLLFKEFIKLNPLTVKAFQPSKSALLEVKDKTPGGPSILNAKS